jgi:hypothetical protein
MREGIRKLCVAYDVEHYSDRGTRREYDTQQRLAGILDFAFREAGVPPAGHEVQEQGDGGMAFLPTGGTVDEPRLIVGLLNALRTGLTDLNEDLVEAAKVRLRVGLQEGVVHRAAHGYVGPAVVEVCRLRDAEAVRQALARSGGPLVAAVADSLYRDVLAHGYHGLPGSAFIPVDVHVKTFSGKAWIYQPGADGGPAHHERPSPGGEPLLRQFLDTEWDTW